MAGVPRSEDLRFYARGMFASPLLTHLDGAWASYLGTPKWLAYTSMALAHSVADWPLRNWSRKRCVGASTQAERVCGVRVCGASGACAPSSCTFYWVEDLPQLLAL